MRLNCSRGRGSNGAGVYAHLAEIVAESGLEEAARCFVKRVTRGSWQLVHYGMACSGSIVATCFTRDGRGFFLLAFIAHFFVATAGA
jgi:hypothetical protein